ncbi:MAG: adenine deaminase [Clostridia bacterium]|nr:adenine deaminase [Clostridia bacterium]
MKNCINAALKRQPADLVLKGGSFVNVFTQQIVKADVAIVGNKIVGFGEGYEGKEVVDITGKIVTPGLIDGHVHIESSQLSPEEFASLIVPRGTTTIIADPHEITNVCGIAGAEYIAKASENVPLEVKVQLPSCVPATPFETSGCVLTGEDTEKYIKNDYIYGLGEMMNYPGVIYAVPDVLKKIEAALALGKVVDGHAPTLSGDALNAYLSAGISTDHECITNEEIEEKIGKGLYCHLRHGSSTRNLVSNAKSVNEKNLRRFILCTDDRHAADLKRKGHLDDALRQLVKSGMDPIWAIVMGTINNAECYGLRWKGAIAPHYDADLVVFDNLSDFNAALVVKDGKIVAKDGKALFDTSVRYLPENVLNTVHLDPVKADDFILTLKGTKAHCIKIIPDNVATLDSVREVKSENGDVVVKGTDILKLAVVERHHKTGNIGLGLLEGYGFKGGAMGITIAHDSHNIILLGDDNEAMATAANHLAKIGGGMVICHDGICESVTLDIGGLMSSKSEEELERASADLIEKAFSMGVNRDLEAFMSLAFLSLAVIPDLKLTDKGLFDVNRFDFLDINA